MPKNVLENTLASGRVLWITGLSGSGKTTLSMEVVRQLKKKRTDIVSLDGDDLRKILAAETTNFQSYDRTARLKYAMQYAHLSELLSKQGFIVVVATISMFREVYIWNRTHLPGYFEIYLNVPIEELRRRDSKQIYSRYDIGELQNVAGLDLNVDVPKTPDLEVVNESGLTLAQLADEIIEKSKVGVNLD